MRRMPLRLALKLDSMLVQSLPREVMPAMPVTTTRLPFISTALR
jgi:hypothetical protein